MADGIQTIAFKTVKRIVRRSCISLLLAGGFCGVVHGQELPEPGDHGTVQKTQSVSHITNPAGTFFPRDNGTLLYFEGIDVFSGVGSTIQNGITSTLYSMGTSFAVMSLIATLPVSGPGAIVAMTMKALWRYRFPLTWWRSYRIALEGMWNYQSRRVGGMPVYFTSPELQRRLVVNWRFPYANERPVQLDIVALPYWETMKATEVPEPEQGWLAMARSLAEKELVRLVISINKEHFVVSAQHQSGQWFYRTLPRPEKPLLAEQLVEWGKREQMDDGFSLLSSPSLGYLTQSLECQESGVPPWKDDSPDRALLDGQEGSLWELIHNDSGNKTECGFLGIADNSTRYGGLAGYMHLSTQNCAQQDALFERCETKGFENQLIERNYVQVVPYWLTTLVLRMAEEGISIGVRTTATPYMPAVAERKPAGTSGTDNAGNDWLAAAEVQWIRGITLSKPDVEGQPARGKVFCRWLRGSGLQGL